MRFEAVLRSGIAAVTIAGVGAAFLILGVAAVSWRTQCLAEPGAGICFGMPAPEAVTLDPSAGIPEPVAETAAEAVAAAQFKAPSVVEPALAEEPGTTVIAATAAPAPAAEPPDQLAEVAEMVASTFESLSAMKAAVNAAAATGGPVQLPAVELAEETAELAADVAATDPVPTVVQPKPVAVAMAAPTAPTKRTVKIIPITTNSAAATAAAIAASPPRSAATDIAAIAPSTVEVLAFANPTAATPAPRKTLKVNDNLVNVRSGPSTESERLLVLKRGDEVRALAVAGDWVEVEVSEGRTGWMLGKFLTDADLTGLPEREVPAETAAAPIAAEPEITEPEAELVAEAAPTEPTTLSGDVRTVRGAGVNVRSSPSSSAEKLFALPGGRKVSVGETQRGWLKVTDEQGRTGWLYEDYVSGS